jgi:hypothetical protein
MKKSRVYMLIVLAACSLILTLVPIVHSQVNEPQNIQVVNKSWYVDLYGNLVVVGQIKNVGQDVIDHVILTGTATTTDQLQQSSYSNVWVSDLTPQQKAPFYMEFPPPQDAYGQSSWYGSSIADVSINVALANATSGYQYPDLKITSSQGSVGSSGDFNGAYLAKGTIKNIGSQAASNVTVVGAFFNSTGTVVGVGYTNYLSPRTLNPGESTSFQVAALDLNQSEVPTSLKITSYELLVQTEGPILQGTAPQATPYTGSGDGNQNPTPTLASGQTTQPTLVYIALVAVIIIAVATTFLFLKRRRKPESVSAEKPAKPAYQPKPSRRNRK